MKQFNWVFTLSIITLLAMPLEVFSQEAQISDNVQKLEIKENEDFKKVKESVNKIEEICNKTDDLETIEWLIIEYVDSLSSEAEISIFQLDSLLMDEKVNWKVRFFSAEIISMLPQQQYVIKDMIEILKDKSENDKVRGSCARALGHMRIKDAVPSLIESIEDPSIYLRERIIWALEDIGDIRAVEPLIRHLDDPFWMVQVLAIRALGTIGDISAIEPLIRKARGEEISEYPEIVRYHAISAIASIDGRQAEKFLIDILRNPAYGDLRIKAADGLGDIKSREAIPFLIEVLKDRDELLRLHAGIALIKLEAKESRNAIGSAIRDSKSEYVKNKLKTIIEEMK